MKKSQIKDIAKSIVKYGYLSQKDLNWICSHLSRKKLKLFMYLLSKEIRANNLTVTYAGELSVVNKAKIIAMFLGKKILFRRDDKNIIGGICLEYSDFILDYSVSGIAKMILNAIKRESL